jgi:hypothetical protein
VPSLNQIYTNYGCNNGQLVILVVGINVYAKPLKQMYQDSLKGLFPLISIEHNLGKVDPVLSAISSSPTVPVYGLIGKNRTILYGGTSGSAFQTKIKSEPGLVTAPQLCGTPIDAQTMARPNTIFLLQQTPTSMVFVLNKQYRTLKADVYALTGKKIQSIHLQNAKRFDLKTGVFAKGVYRVACVTDGISHAATFVIVR